MTSCLLVCRRHRAQCALLLVKSQTAVYRDQIPGWTPPHHRKILAVPAVARNRRRHNNLGFIFNELEEHQKAISCYEKAIEIQPNHASAHNNLGNIFRKFKEFQKAANYFVRSATVFGNAQFLECTYFSNGVENYNKLLNTDRKSVV